MKMMTPTCIVVVDNPIEYALEYGQLFPHGKDPVGGGAPPSATITDDIITITTHHHHHVLRRTAARYRRAA